MSLASFYKDLRENPSGHAYTVALIPGRVNVYLGVDTAGHPSLFVRAQESSAESPMRTAHVSLQLSQEYSLAGVATPGSELFHSLRCEASEAAEVDTFLVLVEALLARHEDEQIDGDALTSYFRSMVRLFSVMPARDLDGERQGLWGELFVMRQIWGYSFWAPFWHSEPTRRFDFSAAARRVEVKTTVASERVHHFSHRQIYAIEGEEIVIASLVLREEDSGLSLRDLIGEARAALQDTEQYLKLEKAVRRAGMDATTEAGPIFDATEAERELAWFRSTDAPHFRVPEPPGVSETRYKVDLSTAPRLDSHELGEWLGSWSPTLPEPAGSRREW